MRTLLLILVSCIALSGAPNLVQAVANTVFSSNTTAGNTLIFACQNNAPTDNLTSITDVEGNTWTRIILAGPGGFWLYAFAAANIVGGTTNALTINGGAVCVRAWYHEFSGLASSLTIDGTAKSASGNSTTCSPGTLTTTNAVDLIFGVGMSNAGTVGGQAPGYTVGTTSSSEDSEWKAVSSTGTYDPFFTTGSSLWTCIGVALQGPASPTSGPKHRINNS